jgi:hypothetical protein
MSHACHEQYKCPKHQVTEDAMLHERRCAEPSNTQFLEYPALKAQERAHRTDSMAVDPAEKHRCSKTEESKHRKPQLYTACYGHKDKQSKKQQLEDCAPAAASPVAP